MKTAIYYFSKCGHTKKYAESLSSRIDCEYYSYHELTYRHLKDFDTIIFMAPIFGNKIQKINKFLKLYKKIKNKNLIVVAVGMAPSTPERRDSLIIVNLLDNYHLRLYELQGGFDASKLSFLTRKIMQLGLKTMMAKDPNMQSQVNLLEEMFKRPIEYNDLNGIERIMNTIRKLERENLIV